ncbi:MAG: DUF4369 domain-containing protein [Bacteroidaceae bacterium]|nr:DUF4369 domain-containing protein [Bacteroidaceae bacterium]
MNTSKRFFVRLNLVAAVAATLVMAACSKPVKVEGTTTLPALEGRMLSLRAYSGGELAVVDSARVIHGRFTFNVPADSVVMASLFLGEESVMPVVLDGGPVEISITETDHRASGTALNDTLYNFIRLKRGIDEQLAALPRRESQMILEGLDHDAILAQLNSEAAVLGAQSDALVTAFIKGHMDDVLGPGVFMIATSGYPYPVMSPQIEEIITFASDAFKNDAYVRDYVRAARENEEKMNEQ